MTYWGRRYDANVWIENARVKWNEVEYLFTRSDGLPPAKNHNSRRMPRKRPTSTSQDTRRRDSIPVGSINRARWPADVASRKARMRAESSREGNRQECCLRWIETT